MDANELLREFEDMWYQIFLFCLASSVFIHCIAACVAFGSLRKHSRGRFFPLMILVIGFLYPLTGGIVTSAFIAAVYKSANIAMENYFAFLWGGGQAFLTFIISFTRFSATL